MRRDEPYRTPYFPVIPTFFVRLPCDAVRLVEGGEGGGATERSGESMSGRQLERDKTGVHRNRVDVSWKRASQGAVYQNEKHQKQASPDGGRRDKAKKRIFRIDVRMQDALSRRTNTPAGGAPRPSTAPPSTARVHAWRKIPPPLERGAQRRPSRARCSEPRSLGSAVV